MPRSEPLCSGISGLRSRGGARSTVGEGRITDGVIGVSCCFDGDGIDVDVSIAFTGIGAVGLVLLGDSGLSTGTTGNGTSGG